MSVSPGQPSRRALLALVAASAGAGLGGCSTSCRTPIAKLGDDPFGLGVASGEPEPDGVVIWTRLAPRPWEPGGGLPPQPVVVRWEVAEDPRFERIAAAGEQLAGPASAHAVHVEVAGLRPGREYWYRFTAAGQRSPTGRTLTAPPPGAPVERLRLAFGSCQRLESGFYAAHRHIAECAPDLVLFLGDYIYEKPISFGGPERHALAEARDLESYRLRHAAYKSDPDLQASHAAAPWMPIWDDHEVENDYGGDQDRANTDPARFLQRRAAAYQAYYEHMPLRRRSIPAGAQMRLYRTLDWGGLAQLQLIDTRQYRPHRTCDSVSHKRSIPQACAERWAPGRSMLGAAQEAWLQDAFRTTAAQWNLLVQQYPMTPLVFPDATVSNDGWDGYVAGRRRILEGWRDARVANPLSIGGDIHSFLAADLSLEPGGAPLASEFVGSSITSVAREDCLPEQAFRSNPNLKFGHREHRGFGLMELTRSGCINSFMAVEDAQAERSAVRKLASFQVESGAPGLSRA